MYVVAATELYVAGASHSDKRIQQPIHRPGFLAVKQSAHMGMIHAEPDCCLPDG